MPRRPPVLFAALLAACSSPPQPGPVEVRSEGSAFDRGAGGFAAVPFTVTNAGASNVLLTATCGDRLAPAVERPEGGRWAQYAGGLCLAVNDMSPKPLAPGASRREVASVGEAGTYRLVVGTDRGPVASGAFTVR